MNPSFFAEHWEFVNKFHLGMKKTPFGSDDFKVELFFNEVFTQHFHMVENLGHLPPP